MAAQQTYSEVGQAADQAVFRSQGYFRRTQHPDGYWWGELESNATMEAEYLMLCHFTGRHDPERWRKVSNYILSKQRSDGSWGQYYEAPGDVSTSVECYFALKLAGHSAESEPLVKAREFILSKGGMPKVRVFTKIWLALFGQWDWKGTPNMPPEMIYLPSWAPFNLYEFASWARATVAPMLIILTRRPYCPVPESANIDELYPGGRVGTDYRLPKPTGGFGWAKALHWADKAVALYHRMPVHPFRGFAERKIMRWVLEHQEADGSWAGIQPPWVYSLIALHVMGYGPEHEAVKKGFQGFEAFAIEDEDTCTVQACVSPVWDTCLAQLALMDSGIAPDDPMVQTSARWLMDKQIFAGGDWQVRAKKTRPGGWSFEFDNQIYPDIDDASIVVMALEPVRLPGPEEPRRAEAIQRGVEWMAGMQSKNGGG
ncbi:MAG: squalene--hopene cyclase, partial [SAR202 cluster bacterium Casp-Chloro-G2]